MANGTLSAAIVGVGGFGARTLQACRESDRIRVVGVSDRSAEAARQAGAEAGVPHFTDNRSLLAETRPDAVFAAVPPMAAGELLAACCERGIHVWKEQPLARDLEEAVAMVQAAEKAGVKLAVGTQWRFSVGYRRARELLQRVGQVFLCRAHYLFNWGPQLGWRGDKGSAGGGALLELGYHPIDLLVWMLGVPEDVYGACAQGNRPDERDAEGRPLPPYDTDDTAAAILRYTGGSVATVVTTRASGPVGEAICVHGRRGSLTADTERCVLRGPEGNVLDAAKDESNDRLTPFRRQAEAFARAVLAGDRCYECSGRENLLNMAVIDAIYLASHTRQPENPARLLSTHKLRVEDCLAHRPAQRPPGPQPREETGASQ